MAIDNAVREALIQAHFEGDRCPELEREVVKQQMMDLRQEKAMLVAIRPNYAEWVMCDDHDGRFIVVPERRVYSRGSGTYDKNNAYEVFEDSGNTGMFRKWLWNSRIALIENGRDPDNLSSPGMLSVSHTLKLIVGWEEDYTDEDARLLALAETMDE